MRTPWLISVGLVALALNACGGATSSTQGTGQTTTRSHSSGAAGSVVTTTVTTTATPTSSAAPVTSQGPSPAHPSGCRAAGLTLRFLGTQGATGHGELGFAIRNTGAGACRTFGYPGVQFLGASGALLPTRSQRTTDDFFGHLGVVEIVLASGGSASFRLGVTHGSASPAACTTARGLQVYPPDDTATLRTTIPGGATECGTATISPMRPGTAAYP